MESTVVHVPSVISLFFYSNKYTVNMYVSTLGFLMNPFFFLIDVKENVNISEKETFVLVK